MKPFKLTFTDCDTEPQTWFCRAYDSEHAADKFWESWESEGGAEGVKLLSVQQIRTRKIKTLYRP